MKKILQCRRTFISFVGIICLLVLGLCKNYDVALAITGIVTALCSANAYQGSIECKHKPIDKVEG